MIVAAGPYVGPGAAIAKIAERFFAAIYDKSDEINGTGFFMKVTIDYSLALLLPLGTVVDRLTITGKRAGKNVVAEYLFQRFEVDEFVVRRETDRDWLELTCAPSTAVQSPEGTWNAAAIEVLVDTGTPSPVQNGDPLKVTRRRIMTAFKTPWTVDSFEAANPFYEVVDLFDFGDNGAIQGYLWAVGRNGTPAFQETLLYTLDFVATGKHVRGSYTFQRFAGTDDRDELFIRADPPAPNAPWDPDAGNENPKSWRLLLRLPSEIEVIRRRIGRHK